MGVDAEQSSLLLFFTMDTFNMMMILAVIIISVYQSSLISATTGEDDIKTLMMEMKNLQKKNQQFEEWFEILNIKIDQQQNDIQEQKEMVAMLQRENLLNQEKLTLLEVDSKKYKEDQTKKVTSLTEDMNSMMSMEHEKSIKVTRDAPEVFYCGFQYGFQYGVSSPSNITYDSMFYSRTNQPTGGLDLATGVFTSPFPGTYTVTYSLYAWNNHDEYVFIFLYKNEVQIDESQHYSSYSGSSGQVRDQGGRTLILHLDMGETLSLRYTGGSGDLERIMFCATLSMFDQIEA